MSIPLDFWTSAQDSNGTSSCFASSFVLSSVLECCLSVAVFVLEALIRQTTQYNTAIVSEFRGLTGTFSTDRSRIHCSGLVGISRRRRSRASCVSLFDLPGLAEFGFCGWVGGDGAQRDGDVRARVPGGHHRPGPGGAGAAVHGDEVLLPRHVGGRRVRRRGGAARARGPSLRQRPQRARVELLPGSHPAGSPPGSLLTGEEPSSTGGGRCCGRRRRLATALESLVERWFLGRGRIPKFAEIDPHPRVSCAALSLCLFPRCRRDTFRQQGASLPGIARKEPPRKPEQRR